MKLSLDPTTIELVTAHLKTANNHFNRTHPGESTDRQPVHTVYGGAHIFRAGTSEKMADSALKHLKAYAPNFVVFAKALELNGHENLPEKDEEISTVADQLNTDPEAVNKKNTAAFFAYTVYQRVFNKLRHAPVEDFRIDFEDGFGYRPDEEEDQSAVGAAEEVAKGMTGNSLPPFIGIRIKPLTEELKTRAIRTLDLFITTLLNKTKG